MSRVVPQPVNIESIVTATLMVCTFIAAMFVLQLAIPPLRRKGVPLRDGVQLDYALTGLATFLLATVAVLAGITFNLFSLRPLLTHFWSLLLVSNIVAFVYSGLLFFFGRRARKRAGLPGQKLWLDLWVGPTLNPRVWGVDLKMFTYQPSLFGFGLINAAFAFAQIELHGALTTQMMLYQAFWWIYLFTHYIYEDFMLQTWDIIAENFGFMLVWGDLVYVPFLYSLCGWFLVDQRVSIPTTAALGLMALFLGSLWIFRGANLQKHRFKQDPHTRIWGKPAEALDGRLLVSGFWGWGRKLNYTGEIGVYTAIALTTGFDSPVPYALPLLLLILLSQRAWRDEQRCKAKYSELWARYRQRARFRMFPFIY